jgi:hypothetical protein
LTEYPQQVIELLGVDSGLEQGHRGVAAGFDSWRQPQSDRGEVTESPDTALTEGDPAEGLQRLGKAAQVLVGFGIDPADEGVRSERKNESPDGTLALDLAHTRELHVHGVPLGVGQGGTRPGWLATWSQCRTPEQECAALSAPMVGDYRADTTPGLGRARPAAAGWRGVNVTSDGLWLLQGLRRSLLEPPRQLRPRTVTATQPDDQSETVSTVA